jgi:hypothetical protein
MVFWIHSSKASLRSRSCLLLPSVREQVQRRYAARALRLISGGSPRYAAQKSLVVDDFAKRLCPSRSDIAANAIENTLHPATRQGIPGDLFIPRIDLAEFEVGEPSQEFLALAQRKRLHLFGDLLNAGRHPAIVALTALWRQAKVLPRNCSGSACLFL